MYIFEYYMIGLRHRKNIRKIKELIEFTQGQPNLILDNFWGDVFFIVDHVKVSRAQAVKALKNNKGDLVDAVMELTFN